MSARGEASLLERSGVPGTLRVFGCPAEETQGVKVYMARAGLFSSLDACLHWHPAPFATVADIRTAAGDMIRIEFHARSAHAGVDPWNGRSALDALELLAHADRRGACADRARRAHG